jgi:dienelactone hydrolase
MLAAVALIAMQVSAKEVTFKGAGGFELNGTLVMPAGAKNAPAFVLLSGSGPTDRDGNTPLITERIDTLKQVAERMAQEGVASLRFDKRAIQTYRSKWPKDMSQIGQFFSWENFVADAAAAHSFLMTQPGIDPNKVGMLGHSEGALIALKVSTDPANKVHGLIMMGGQGRPLDVVVMQQLREKLPGQLASVGASDQLSKYLHYAETAFAQLKVDGTIPANTPAGLQGLFNPSALVFYRGNLKDDPAKLATVYGGDVLVMNGQFDNQVSPQLDAMVLSKAFQTRTTGKVQLVLVPGASHAFKATPNHDTDAMGGPMLPEALDAIATWCKGHMLNGA